MERVIFGFLALLGAVAAAGYRLAGQWCAPEDGYGDPSALHRAVERVQLLGLVAVSAAHVYWLGWPHLEMAWLGSGIGHLVLASARTIATLGLCSIVSVLLLVLFGGQHRRSLMAESRGPLQALLAVVIVAIAWWALVAIATPAMNHAGSNSSFVGLLAALGLGLVVIGSLVGLLGASAAVLWLGARHKMRIVEGPLVLLPTGVMITALIALAESTMRTVTSGLLLGYPIWVAVATAFLGPCLAVVLAAYGYVSLGREGGLLRPRFASVAQP